MFMPDHSTARALLAFRAAHGRRWKAKLLFLWSTGRDVEEANGACLRQLRNQGGPAWLGQLSPRRWRVPRSARPMALIRRRKMLSPLPAISTWLPSAHG